jgi:hypothetical protein
VAEVVQQGRGDGRERGGVVDAVVWRQLGLEGAHAVEVALHDVGRAQRMREAGVFTAGKRERCEAEGTDPPQSLDLRAPEQPREPPLGRAGEGDQPVNGIAQDHRRQPTAWPQLRWPLAGAAPA